MYVRRAALRDWDTKAPEVSRWAINSSASSLTLTALSGVPPVDGVGTVASVVARVRIIELGVVRYDKKHTEDGNTYVPVLIRSESRACFFASIMYRPVPNTACSMSSQSWPLITADPMVRVGLLCNGPNMASA